MKRFNKIYDSYCPIVDGKHVFSLSEAVQPKGVRVKWYFKICYEEVILSKLYLTTTTT